MLEVVAAFERVNNLKLNYKIGDARPGDIAESYADCSKAERELGWKATRTLDDMVASAWRWRKRNPNGLVDDDDDAAAAAAVDANASKN